MTPGAIVGVLHNQSYAGNAAKDVLHYTPIFSRYGCLRAGQSFSHRLVRFREESKIRTMRYMKDVVLPKLRSKAV